MKILGALIFAFLLLVIIPSARAQILGTTNLLEGPSASSDSVALAVLPIDFPWTVVANDSWLHLSVANQSGVGSTNVIFTFDANLGPTRIGTINIAGQTLTVTQAGSNYIAAANSVTTLDSGLAYPYGMAVDDAGNVYIADQYYQAILKWLVAYNDIGSVAFGLNGPTGVAVDKAGNAYIIDQYYQSIRKWVAAQNTFITLATNTGPNFAGIAVDSVGNVYFSDSGGNAIKKWSVVSGTVTTLVSTGLNGPRGVAVDDAGNVYFCDAGNQAVKKWTAANGIVTTLVSSGLLQPVSVAVDGSGNVYIADITDPAISTIKEWVVTSNILATLVPSGLSRCYGVAADRSCNVYFIDYGTRTLEELPHVFVDPSAKVETAAAGSDVLPAVLPITANLTGPFAPVSDSDWLTFKKSTNGVVCFDFTANPLATYRKANISLLGQSIAVTQSAKAVIPPILTDLTILNNGSFQFGFTNNQGASFSIWTTTNLLLPMTNWVLLGTLTNDGSGEYQVTDVTVTNGGQRFYRVSSP